MCKIITAVVLIVILFSIYYLIDLDDKQYKIEKYTNTDDQILSTIRTILSDIHGLFRTEKIEYWMDGGTLLGAVRHKGVIPWDDDGDLCIYDYDKEKFLSLEPKLNLMGYGLAKFWGGYKIYPFNGIAIQDHNRNWQWTSNSAPEGIDLDKESNADDVITYKYPFIDIFFCSQYGNIVHYSNKKVKALYPNYYHEIKDMYPLRQYEFDGFVLMGPNNPIPYLDRAFGTEWSTVGYKSYDHLNMRFLPKTTIPIKNN